MIRCFEDQEYVDMLEIRRAISKARVAVYAAGDADPENASLLLSIAADYLKIADDAMA